MEFKFNNVNDAFKGLVSGIHNGEIATTRRPSRNGNVLQIEEPVTVCYLRPWERVLFNTHRDANPFFHLFEALWMLAGRNDVEPLSRYTSQMGQFSDDGETLNGAYGHRWRHANKDYEDIALKRPGVNQLDRLIDHLRSTPTSRRAVLQMWNVEDDLLKIDTSKDVCCNTAAYFSIRESEHGYKLLDMTVTNRSNDLILGMLGANVVHFSILQEYVACCLGINMGRYYQISNNLHVYESNWEPEHWLSFYEHRTMYSLIADYVDRTRTHVPLVLDKEVFDREVKSFVNGERYFFKEPFLRDVASFMFRAFDYHKERDYVRVGTALDQMVSCDWRITCTEWIKRRENSWRLLKPLI